MQQEKSVLEKYQQYGWQTQGVQKHSTEHAKKKARMLPLPLTTADRPDPISGGDVTPPAREGEWGTKARREPTWRRGVGREGDLGPHRNRRAPPAASAPRSPYRFGVWAGLARPTYVAAVHAPGPWAAASYGHKTRAPLSSNKKEKERKVSFFCLTKPVKKEN